MSLETHAEAGRPAGRPDPEVLEANLFRALRKAAVVSLVQGVPHELNNPLTGILGYAQLILLGLEPGHPLRADLEEIERSALRCQEVADRLSALTKEEDLPAGLFFPNLVLEESLAFLKTRASRRKVRLVQDLDAALPPLVGKVADFRFCLLMLIQNAFLAMPDGGTLTLTSRGVNDFVEIEVADTGIGVSERIAGEIFQPYRTFWNEGNSLGLGLFLARRAASSLGGVLEQIPASHPGACFRLTVTGRSDG